MFVVPERPCHLVYASIGNKNEEWGWSLSSATAKLTDCRPECRSCVSLWPARVDLRTRCLGWREGCMGRQKHPRAGWLVDDEGVV
jgi:hypothetical protein